MDKAKQYPLIEIEWDDHSSDDHWHLVEEALNTPKKCVSVGWLVWEDDKGITIISAINEDFFGCSQYLVKSCITKRKVLRKGASPKKSSE